MAVSSACCLTGLSFLDTSSFSAQTRGGKHAGSYSLVSHLRKTSCPSRKLRFASPRLGARAAAEDGTSVTTQEAEAPPKKTVVRRRVPAGSEPAAPAPPMVPVEDNRVTMEGVAKVDRGEAPFMLGRAAVLAGGDATALLLFAAIGRLNHTRTLDLGVLETAAPFLVSWFVAGALLESFGPDAQGLRGTGTAAGVAAKAWAVGIPAGLALRAVLKGQVPAQPFIIVTLATTAVFLIGWRTAYSLTAPKDLERTRGNRKGNPFEFFQLLSSLVRRW